MPVKCQCGHENPDSAFHCENCGEQLGVERKEYAPYQNNPYQNNQYGGQQGYYAPQQPYQPQLAYTQAEKPVSIGAWVGLLIVFCIPFVNIIAFIITLCAAENKTLKNYIIANFILAAIMIALFILLVVVVGVSMAELADAFANYY
ncbi:MAG: hypothetical protein IKK42_00100 [Oscillospiraceae bacterium]|nr:hypothetical protein [Oscillospiraceae bacterium]